MDRWYEELLRDFFSTCFVKDDLFLKFDLDMFEHVGTMYQLEE